VTEEATSAGRPAAVALVLAADEPDAASGFSGSRYVADVGGSPLLGRVLESVRSWPVDEIVVVVGPDAEEILERVDVTDAIVVVDEGWEEGSASPLRAGMDTVWRESTAPAVVVLPGDVLDVPASVVAALVERWRSVPRSGVAPRYRYAAGWPVVVGRELLPDLLGVEGEVDLPALLASHAGLELVHVDRAAPRRVRTIDDLPLRRR